MPIKKGSQAFYNYGFRTNLFLLINYGFCIPDNLYDSLKFNVRVSRDFDTEEYPDVKEMMH